MLRVKRNYLENSEATQGDHYQSCADNVKKPDSCKQNILKEIEIQKQPGQGSTTCKCNWRAASNRTCKKIESEAASRRKLSDDRRTCRSPGKMA